MIHRCSCLWGDLFSEPLGTLGPAGVRVRESVPGDNGHSVARLVIPLRLAVIAADPTWSADTRPVTLILRRPACPTPTSRDS